MEEFLLWFFLSKNLLMQMAFSLFLLPLGASQSLIEVYLFLISGEKYCICESEAHVAR